MKTKKTLKQIVFELMDKNQLTDLAVFRAFGKMPKFTSVLEYKRQYLKEKNDKK